MTLAARLAAGEVLALDAVITHARRGALRHSFRTRADHVMLAPATARPPRGLSLDRFNLLALYRRDHGGARGAGTGTDWPWDQFAQAGLDRAPGRVLALLTQPRFLGYWFNPVSFWMLLEGDALCAVIAEVNNTFGQRHSYLLAPPDGAPITAATRLSARKVFHVSPFQDVAGEYRFRFALRPDSLSILIAQIDGEAGVETAMTGALRPLTTKAIVAGALRRPGGALRVIAQIYWHALRLKLKGAAYRPLPPAPHEEISR
ncbi:DUF1365 domain-containing protein [Sinirhodobacter ferrireducens]|uniref:DUF1365 domain-containing protein n=1 Tax=Paenirhodobacter ferrireducens TaxID=1215032 RepID=A0A443L6P7_9RHOB|nr:DUF1365 domain-containing protein [Sinirhodobacter ferrireducens]RWR44733.1 DUF1365 domain-containing protein [Sinirhodobacter ferrireducens]